VLFSFVKRLVEKAECFAPVKRLAVKIISERTCHVLSETQLNYDRQTLCDCQPSMPVRVVCISLL